MIKLYFSKFIENVRAKNQIFIYQYVTSVDEHNLLVIVIS